MSLCVVFTKYLINPKKINGCLLKSTEEKTACNNNKTLKTSMTSHQTSSRQVPKIHKKVHFSQDTKTHDGLSPENNLYDEIVHDLFNRPDNRYLTIRTLLNLDYPGIQFPSQLIHVLDKINYKIINLSDRCQYGKIPVLSHGGGRHNIVDHRFFFWLYRLTNKIEEFKMKIQKFILNNCNDENNVNADHVDIWKKYKFGDNFNI